MSKRFGRNRRRRAREALAEAQAHVAQLEAARRIDAALLDHQTREIYDLRGRIAGVANLVGDQAVIAGEPTELNGGFDGMRLSPPGSFQDFEMRGQLLEAITIETLRLLDVRAIHDHFARQLHFRVRLSNGDVAYGISEGAIHSMPSDVLIRRLTPEIARQLVHALRSKRNG